MEELRIEPAVDQTAARGRSLWAAPRNLPKPLLVQNFGPKTLPDCTPYIRAIRNDIDQAFKRSRRALCLPLIVAEELLVGLH